MLDAQGEVRKDIFKPRGDIHLNAAGTQIVSLKIQQMLKIMLPDLMPVQAPAPVQTPPAPVQAPSKVQRVRVLAPVQDEAPATVVVNMPSVVNTTLVAAVVNTPVVVNQDQVESPIEMEIEDEDSILKRLFFKRFGRALPDEKEKEDEVDQIKFVIDLTKDEDEMEVATSEDAPVAVVKTESIEAPEVAKRRSFRLERLELAKARKHITEFGKSLRKKNIILEKEAPLAAGTENVIADNDTDMAEDVSANPVGSVNAVESGNTTNADQIIAEIDAAIEASQKAIDEFDE